MIIGSVTIDQRFNGPPVSANGGWAGGILARHLVSEKSLSNGLDFASISVSLRSPPPLNSPLQIHRNADASVSLRHDALELAEAQLEEFDLVLPKAPSLLEAQAASAIGYDRGLLRASWPYARCFACGVSRSDGLCITPSPLANHQKKLQDPHQDPQVIAASWTPSAWLAELNGQVRLEAVWAALDCPAGIAWSYQLPDGSPMGTARMSVSIKQLPKAGQAHIVLGWPIGREGRKLYAGTALFSAEGLLLARSKQLWLLPKPM